MFDAIEWIVVYDFAADTRRIDVMQKATLGPTHFGVSLAPALVGSPDWWRAIEDGRLVRRVTQGTIERVYWGSMGDWPEFELAGDGGTRSRWTREGDLSRYVEGLCVRLTHTAHPWKAPDHALGLGEGSTITLRVEIERSDERSDPRAPGPGGVGLRGR